MNCGKILRDLTIVKNATKALKCLEIMKMFIMALTVVFCAFEIIYGFIKNKKCC